MQVMTTIKINVMVMIFFIKIIFEYWKEKG